MIIFRDTRHNGTSGFVESAFTFLDSFSHFDVDFYSPEYFHCFPTHLSGFFYSCPDKCNQSIRNNDVTRRKY